MFFQKHLNKPTTKFFNKQFTALYSVYKIALHKIIVK